MTMLTNILSKLTALIESNKTYMIDGSLNRNLLAADARKYDSGLLNLLQKDSEIKEHFFANTDGGLVFKKDVFLQFITNKEFLPDSYTKYKIKIGLGSDDSSLLLENDDVVLNWPYKDTILEGGQDKEDQRRSEVFFNEVLAPDQITRLLDDKVFTNWKRYDKNGERDLDELKDEDNLIIKGNNLVVLHSLNKRYAGKVKLIYIDPPYNTGTDSFGYNDRFNHSTWLTFMKNRLEAAKDLLSSEGAIFVQCDDEEQGYLKVLMDEIFGRENYINTISVNMKNVAGASGGGEDKRLKKNIEYIHVFARNYITLPAFKNVYEYIPVHELVKQYKDEGKSWKYTSVLYSGGGKEYIGSTTDGDGNEIKIYKRLDAVIKSIGQIIKEEGLTEEEAYKAYASKTFQTAMPQSSIRPRVMQKVQDLGIKGDLFSIEYVPRSGRNKGKTYEQFYKGESFRLFAWLGDVTEEKDGILYKKEAQGTYWDLVGETKNLTKEGQVVFPNGKKPEKLISNIIDMATSRGDLVLDYHLGSGTTAAVAHKMERQYIGIEQLYYGENDAITRLNNVIESDQSGVSKKNDWRGGGSFVYANIMNNANKFRKHIEAAKNDIEYLELLKEATTSSFLSYRVDPKKLNVDEFRKLSNAEKRRLLLELIDNNTLYVNYEDINDPSFKISEKDKEFNKKLYEKN